MTTYVFAYHKNLMLRLALNDTDDDLWTAIHEQYGHDVFELLEEGEVVDVINDSYPNTYKWDLKFEPSDWQYLAKYLAE